MDEQTLRNYRRLRSQNPTLGARNALRWAKSLTKPLAYDWSVNPGNHVNAATTTREGFDIRILVDYDLYADRRAEYTDNNTGIRNPDFDWDDGDGYHYRNNPQKGNRYIEVESGYTVPSLADDYNKMGMSKSVALDVARKSLEDEAREYLADEWASYVITVKASLSGIEMGSASLDGTETSMDTRDEVEFEVTVDDYDLIGEAIENARESMTHLLAAKEALDKQSAVC
jgi:hypothetical protein